MVLGERTYTFIGHNLLHTKQFFWEDCSVLKYFYMNLCIEYFFLYKTKFCFIFRINIACVAPRYNITAAVEHLSLALNLSYSKFDMTCTRCTRLVEQCIINAYNIVITTTRMRKAKLHYSRITQPCDQNPAILLYYKPTKYYHFLLFFFF